MNFVTRVYRNVLLSSLTIAAKCVVFSVRFFIAQRYASAVNVMVVLSFSLTITLMSCANTTERRLSLGLLYVVL